MDEAIRARCVGCQRYVAPPPEGVAYGANSLGSPYLVFPCPKGHPVRWFIKWQPGPPES